MDAFPHDAPTALLELPKLAQAAGIARLFAKCENERPFGNFKILGGMRAGLNALAAAAGISVDSLLKTRPANLPRLIAASDGNHGLAVAAAASRAGTRATIFLPTHASPIRAHRIESQGGMVAWIRGTYDDAVAAAEARAASGDGILISDTTANSHDPIVQDVMAGYTRIANEIVAQMNPVGLTYIDKVFVQAGVGGLAAAMAEGLQPVMRAASILYTVEPETVACVAAALSNRRPTLIAGDLETEAEMLSCGLASALAVEILLLHHAQPVTVSETQLRNAVVELRKAGGPATTPSGAAGLAGLFATKMNATDSALIFVTEAALQAD